MRFSSHCAPFPQMLWREQEMCRVKIRQTTTNMVTTNKNKLLQKPWIRLSLNWPSLIHQKKLPPLPLVLLLATKFTSFQLKQHSATLQTVLLLLCCFIFQFVCLWRARRSNKQQTAVLFCGCCIFVFGGFLRKRHTHAHETKKKSKTKQNVSNRIRSYQKHFYEWHRTTTTTTTRRKRRPQ